MSNLKYPFHTKEEAEKYLKETELECGVKCSIKKVKYTTFFYKIFPEPKKSVKRVKKNAL